LKEVVVRRTLELAASFASGGIAKRASKISGHDGRRPKRPCTLPWTSQKVARGCSPSGPDLVSPVAVLRPQSASGGRHRGASHPPGRPVNQPLALSVVGRLEEVLGNRTETIADDDFRLTYPTFKARLPKRLIPAHFALGIGEFWRDASEAAEGPACSRRLPQSRGRPCFCPLGNREATPLWITRLRAKRLFDAVWSVRRLPRDRGGLAHLSR
jgi:hypothetical protein